MGSAQPNTSDAVRLARLARVRILVADNDEFVSLLVRNVLKNLGFQNLTLVKDGEKALESIRGNPTDLLITDWQMDPLNGFDLVKFIRTSPDSPNKFLPIIMLSGNGEYHDIEKARDVGVTEYVIKPFTAKALVERICLVIDNPRRFVISPVFKGPDRRRKQLPLPKNAIERRKAA